METPQDSRETQKKTLWSQRRNWTAASYANSDPYPSLTRKATDFITIVIMSHCLRACVWLPGPKETAASLHVQWHTPTYLSVCGVPPPLNFTGFDLSASITTLGSLFYCDSLPTPAACHIMLYSYITRFKTPTPTTLWHTMTQRHPVTLTHCVCCLLVENWGKAHLNVIYK